MIYNKPWLEWNESTYLLEKSETAKIVIVYMKIECHCRQVSDSHTYKRTTQYRVWIYLCVRVCMCARMLFCTCLMNTCEIIKRYVLVCRWIDIWEEFFRQKRAFVNLKWSRKKIEIWRQIVPLVHNLTSHVFKPPPLCSWIACFLCIPTLQNVQT